MKKILKGVAFVLALALMTSVFTACGDPVELDKYGETVAATLGDEQIMLDEANFFLRYEQYQMESYYWDMYTTYYGYKTPWAAPYNETKTLGDFIKERIMQELYQTRTLCNFASKYNLSYDDVDMTQVESKATELYEGLETALLAQAPVTQEQVTEWVKMNALANLVHQAIEDEADTTYTDEEVTVYGVSYIQFTDDEVEEETEEATTLSVSDEEAEEVEETEAEEATEATTAPKTGEDKAKDFIATLESSDSFDAAAETAGLTDEVQTANYLVAGEEDADDDLIYVKSKKLAVGEYNTFYDKDSKSWVVVYRTTDNDEEAKETQIETVIQEKKDAHFAEVIEALYKEGPSFKVTDAWKNVVVTDGSRLVPTTAADEEDAETADAQEIVDALQDDINAVAEAQAAIEDAETTAQ